MGLSARTAGEERLELIIAGRTMDTLTQYVGQVEDNLARGEPVVTNENVLGEIRDVAALVVSMLNDYITGEIGSAAAMSVALNRIVLLTAIAEVLLVAFTLLRLNRTAEKAAERLVSCALKQKEGEP